MSVSFIKRLAILLDDFFDALVGNHSSRHLHDHSAQVSHWEDNPYNQPGVRQVGSDSDLTVDRHQGANQVSGEQLQTAEHVRDWPEERVHGERFLPGRIFPSFLSQILDFMLLAGKRFDDLNAGEIFL
jgi:hypothetical protein